MLNDNGRFNWFELVTKDVERAKAFYQETFPWKAVAAPMPGMDYTLIQLGESSIAGITEPQQKGVPTHWLSYVQVADVDATAKKVKKAGGKALADGFDVPSVGRMQPVADPQGAAFCLFAPADGSTPKTEGAGSWHWNERISQDPAALLDFYKDVLGYSHEAMEMPQGTYYLFKNGDEMRGGLMKAMSPDMPSVWLQYVSVDDADETLARAKRNGATLQGEAMTVPGVGRFGVITDPTGGTLGVITPDPAPGS